MSKVQENRSQSLLAQYTEEAVALIQEGLEKFNEVREAIFKRSFHQAEKMGQDLNKVSSHLLQKQREIWVLDVDAEDKTPINYKITGAVSLFQPRAQELSHLLTDMRKEEERHQAFLKGVAQAGEGWE